MKVWHEILFFIRKTLWIWNNQSRKKLFFYDPHEEEKKTKLIVYDIFIDQNSAFILHIIIIENYTRQIIST